MVRIWLHGPKDFGFVVRILASWLGFGFMVPRILDLWLEFLASWFGFGFIVRILHSY